MDAVGAVVVFLVVITIIGVNFIFNQSNKVDKKDNTQKTTLSNISNKDLTIPKDNQINLEHKACYDDNIRDCMHQYSSTTKANEKICKNCGHRNSYKATKCSVCGKRFRF